VVTKVVEVVQSVRLGDLLPDATSGALERHAGWLRPHFLDEAGATELSIHAFVVESRGCSILVDTCVGHREIPGMPGLMGPEDFPDRLAAVGHPAEDIDVVCCTHLHFDHVGWNTRRVDGAWVPTFPNARYLFCRTEFEHWTGRPGGYALNLDDTVAPVVEAGLADLVEPDHVITDEVRLVPSRGHSPGHVCVLIRSGDEQALITGDATHHPVQWAEPDWSMAADWDAALGARTRRDLSAEHGPAGTLVLGTHYASPSSGRLVAEGDGWTFAAEG
jgi:glyoxylase-like metal-dependent hydrolase (beta-lactamase superfamily II)